MTAPDWSETDAFRQEHARLRAASEHVARAVAELTHAAQTVGDHASAVALAEAIEGLQLTQAQLATAAERAFSLGQLAARRARHAEFQRQVDRATTPGMSIDADPSPDDAAG
jgi:hypothetical protein